jgi:hypothetical protein
MASLFNGFHRAARASWAPAALALAVLGALGGCASVSTTSASVEYLLQDAKYTGAVEPVDAASAMAMSPAMLRYADEQLSTLSAQRDPRKALLDALYKDGSLRLSYDNGNTRNAAEAFDARSGNCMSLVLMTAAFARHLGLPVSFQSVLVDSGYTRSGDLVLVSGHVNLVLGRTTHHAPFTWSANEDWVVDFLPGAQLRGQRAVLVDEATVLAMYFNNRAAEALADGQRTAGYAWARLALRTAPRFMPAVNTLAVLYLRDGHLPAAEAALRHVLARDADSTSALANLALLLQRTERHAEARLTLHRLAQLQPDNSFLLFDQGRLAMDRGDYKRARELFESEINRQPGQSEVHFWAALAEWHLGNAAHASQQLQLALNSSTSDPSRALYAGKLAWLKALPAH